MDGYQAFFQHPLVQLGAGMMQGADPRGQGLGGLGFGVLNTGRLMRERAKLDEQNRRAEALQNLQLQTYRAKLAQQQARENLAGMQGVTPMQAAGIRAGFGPQVAGQLFAKPQAPLTEIGKLTRELQAGNITRDEYDLLMKEATRPGTSHISVDVDQTTGNVSITDKLKETVTFVTPDNQVRTVAIRRPTTIEAQPVAAEQEGIVAPEGVAEQETAITPQGEVVEQGIVAPPEVAEDPFAQQQWMRQFRQMPGEQQNRYTAAQLARGKLPDIIERVRQNTGAFGAVVGGAGYMPEHMQEGLLGKVYEDIQSMRLTPEQQKARADVVREASLIINELAGAAVSGQEAKRIERFLPKGTDNAEQIINKLESAISEAESTSGILEKQFALPRRDLGATRRKWQETPSGIRYRWK